MTLPTKSPRNGSYRIYKDNNDKIRAAQGSIETRKIALCWLNSTSSATNEITNVLYDVDKRIRAYIPEAQAMFCENYSGRGTDYNRPDIRRGRVHTIEIFSARFSRLVGRMNKTRECLETHIKQVEKAVRFDECSNTNRNADIHTHDLTRSNTMIL